MILNVKWPQDRDSQQLSNFETMARKLRYRALGRACLEHNLQSLLLAHHKDDQAETVMMRIAQGHRGTGLRGMLPVSDIPECWAIHGAHQSGAREATEKTKEIISTLKGFQYGNSKPSQSDLQGEPSPPLKIEDGGIKVYRPFLGFDKERLKATCRASQVAWVEDKTNQNPALTPRNAIRKLLRLGKLPEAIKEASLSALARRVQQKHITRMTRAESYFRLCMLDTRVGLTIFRLKHRTVDRSMVPAIHLHQVLLEEEYKTALVLRRMMEMVTPAQGISLEVLYPAVKALFPKRLDSTSGEQTCKLTCGGVYFERIRSDVQKTASPSFDPDFVWMLARQPFASTSPSPSLVFPRITESNEGSTFSLWDGRFWFRVVNRHTHPVVIRPLYPADLALLRVILPKGQAKYLDEVLRIAAPGKIRWTLPVIAEAEEDSQEAVKGSHEAEESSEKAEETRGEAEQNNQEAEVTPQPNRSSNNARKGKETSEWTRIKSFQERTGGKVLALPTLNLDYGAKEKGINWEVRYKKVQFPNHKNFSSIIL